MRCDCWLLVGGDARDDGGIGPDRCALVSALACCARRCGGWPRRWTEADRCTRRGRAGLFDVAAKHNDEPAPEQLTQRLRARAAEVQAACKKAEAEDGGCDDAFYLSCSAGEAQEFWLSGFDGAAAVYSFSVPPREFMRVNYVDQGGWKVDAKSCGGPAHYGEPWAKAQP